MWNVTLWFNRFGFLHSQYIYLLTNYKKNSLYSIEHREIDTKSLFTKCFLLMPISPNNVCWTVFVSTPENSVWISFDVWHSLYAEQILCFIEKCIEIWQHIFGVQYHWLRHSYLWFSPQKLLLRFVFISQLVYMY